jgi:hypothetical protein
MNIYEMIGRGVVFCGMPITFVLILSAFAAARKKEAKKIHDSTQIKYNSRYPLTVLLVLLCFGLKAQKESLYFPVSYSYAINYSIPHLSTGGVLKLPTNKKLYTDTCGYIYHSDTSYIQVKDSSLSTVSTPVYNSHRVCVGSWFWRKCSTVTDIIYKDSTYWKYSTHSVQVIKKDSTAIACATTLCTGVAIRNIDWVNTVPKYTDWGFIGTVQNFVLNVSPDELSPKEGSYNWTKFDSATVFADRAKAQGIAVRYKIRITNGVFAPQWAKAKFGKFYLHGASYADAGWSAVADSFSVKTWDPGYVAWWATFMRAVAAKIKGNPYFSEIVISGTASATAEPLNLAIGNAGEGAQRRDDYLRAGCTDELRIASLYASFDAMDVFDISFSIALNPYEHILPITYMDTAISMQMGEYLAKKYGNRMALGNNGLRPAEVDVDWQPGGKMYAMCRFYKKMKAQYGSKIYFQTASDKQIGLSPTDTPAKYMALWQETWDSGAALEAQFLELPDTEKTLKTVMGDQTNTILNKYTLLYKGNQ